VSIGYDFHSLVLLVLVWLVLIHPVPSVCFCGISSCETKSHELVGIIRFFQVHTHTLLFYMPNGIISFCELASESFVMIITRFIPFARIHKIKLDRSKKLNCVWFLKTFQGQTDCSRTMVAEVGGSLHCVQEVQYPHSPSIVLDFLLTFQAADFVTKSAVSQFLAALCSWSYSFSEKVQKKFLLSPWHYRWIDHLHNDMFKMQLTFTST